MICGATRGSDGGGLAAYLLDHTQAHTIVPGAPRGLLARTLGDQLAEMTARARRGRSRKPLLHVHADPPPGEETWSTRDWFWWWQAYEHEFRLAAQPYAEVLHRTGQRTHVHRIYLLVRRDGGCVPLGHDYQRREYLCRLAEHRTGAPLIAGRHNLTVAARLAAEGRTDVADAMVAAGLLDLRRPFAVSPRRRRQAERTGVDPVAVEEAVLAAWRASDSADTFRRALAEADLRLALGRRAVIVLDRACGTHPLNTLLADASWRKDGRVISAASVAARLAAVRLPRHPTPTHAKEDTGHEKTREQPDTIRRVPAPPTAGLDRGGVAQDPGRAGATRRNGAPERDDRGDVRDAVGGGHFGAAARPAAANGGGGWHRSPARDAGSGAGAPGADRAQTGHAAAPSRRPVPSRGIDLIRLRRGLAQPRLARWLGTLHAARGGGWIDPLASGRLDDVAFRTSLIRADPVRDDTVPPEVRRQRRRDWAQAAEQEGYDGSWLPPPMLQRLARADVSTSKGAVLLAWEGGSRLLDRQDRFDCLLVPNVVVTAELLAEAVSRRGWKAVRIDAPAAFRAELARHLAARSLVVAASVRKERKEEIALPPSGALADDYDLFKELEQMQLTYAYRPDWADD